MANPTHADIVAHLATLAAPPSGLGELHSLAIRLCELQQTLTPATTPRRVVLFAADHGPDAESLIAGAIQSIVAGGSASAVLAKAANVELVLVDVGSRCDPLPESSQYRSRKVRAGSRDHTRQPALTVEEFLAAFGVGQREAERAHTQGMKLVAADAIGSECLNSAARMQAAETATHTDPVPAFAAVGSTDLAAIAGFIAKSAELGLTILVEGTIATAALSVAERLRPGTATKVLRRTSQTPQVEGLNALLAFPLLDAAATIVTKTETREPQERTQVRVKSKRKIAVFTGSFDPPTTYHRRVVIQLRERGFDEVIVRPAGPRCDRPEIEHAKPIHRAVLADLAFSDIPGVSVDLSDLDDAVFTPHFAFDDLLADRGEVWHVVSADFVANGCNSESAIHTKWECGIDAWNTRRFVVLHPSDAPPAMADRPPVCQLVAVDGHVPTVDIRLRVFQGGEAKPDVPPQVEEYIRRYRLFSGISAPRETRVRLRDVRLKIVLADKNKKAVDLAEPFRRFESSDPTHILVLGGDGTMLQAIRDHWRLRLPFLGLNAGTLGFLMNESFPAELEDTEIVLYRMPMMRVDAEMPDGKRTQSLAFADAWVERDSGQAAWLKIDVDGRTQVPRVVGDGLLVATPAGSSAYARAMGATSVPLTAPVFTLAGSNVFRPRFWKPVALPEGARVGLTSLDHNGKRPIRGFIDGQPIGAVKSMNVRVSTIAMVELGFTPQYDLSERLLRSMFPPSDAL
jgi:NAD kinase/NaMN:DMB phosphoribosyltransferase